MMHIDNDDRFMRGAEGLCLSNHGDRSSIYIGLECGVDEYLNRVKQVGDKRDGQSEVRHMVAGVLGSILKGDAALRDLDIVEREQEWLRAWLPEPLDDIPNIVGQVFMAYNS